MKTLWIVLALATAGFAAEQKFSKQQLAARFYYDLGPSQIDVSQYPKEQKKNYLVFKQICSQCHTLARPINSPYVARKDWKRYVERMHLRSEVWPNVAMNKDFDQDILSFLAYDSKIRKVDQRKQFQAATDKLSVLFVEVSKERSRLQMEEGKQKAQPQAPYTGTK